MVEAMSKFSKLSNLLSNFTKVNYRRTFMWLQRRCKAIVVAESDSFTVRNRKKIAKNEKIKIQLTLMN